ncbi:uncharacterized protein LY89DRAFT_788806 [Mollisia scopiformis]|uniref:Heterokaryon incompatibility domain-containing protein n=1 Tax=Mollisia scopiformis TaxID=149040 RepID=A0A132B7L4_MOLSC|nr:uncharacterized protein LY89DRAFT_788806 [Mollisia scopiformis]KUJ08396.1 hypothetical protein LY89DRAFT_788806 [Mollisia scopiformis]
MEGQFERTVFTPKTYVKPLPSFASPSEYSDSSRSSDIVPIIDPRAAPQADVPFSGWASKHLSPYQDLKILSCEICTPAKRRSWWSIVFLAVCAKRGCERCTLRLLGIFKIIQRDRIGPDLVHTQVHFQDSIITLRHHPEVPGLEKQVSWVPFFPWNRQSIKVELYASPDRPTLGWEPVFGVGRDVMECRKKSYTRLVFKWLVACLVNHPLCGYDLQPLPPLIIDVGPEGSTSLRLCGSLGVRKPYVVLSYCYRNWWRAPTTTRESLRRHVVDIPFHGLPPVFQDAVQVVRNLGLRYLWTDSLCMVQDDEHNLSNDIRDLASVYKNAVFVLGAYRSHHVKNGSDEVGLLPTVYDPLRGYQFADVENIDGSITQVSARLLRNPHGLYCGVSRSTKYGVWSRPWALQEQLLSSRMIHFTEGELIWECNSLVGCECMELDRPGRMKSALHKKAWYNKLLRQPMCDEFYKFWWYMLSQYSGRTFTCGEEVLLAISGLASQMQKHGAGQYIAGLWKNDLPQNLLWDRHSPIIQPPKDYIAPSWSWASRITYPHEIHADNPNYGELGPAYQIVNAVHKEDLAGVYAEVLDVKAIPKSGNPFGSVRSGHITLSGPLIKAKFREHPLVYNKGTKRAKSSMICPLFPDGTPVWTCPDFDPMPFEVEDELLLLLVAKERGKSRKRRYMRYKGLMLVKSKTGPYHERIGTWEVPVLNEYNDIEASDFFQGAKEGIVRIV